jgi:hypothetical protein
MVNLIACILDYGEYNAVLALRESRVIRERELALIEHRRWLAELQRENPEDREEVKILYEEITLETERFLLDVDPAYGNFLVVTCVVCLVFLLAAFISS